MRGSIVAVIVTALSTLVVTTFCAIGIMGSAQWGDTGQELIGLTVLVMSPLVVGTIAALIIVGIHNAHKREVQWTTPPVAYYQPQSYDPNWQQRSWPTNL